MTETEILNICKVGDLFTNDKNIIKKEYHNLAMKYHPDIYNGKKEIFIKIKSLYEKALNLIELEDWEKSNVIFIKSKQGKSFEVKYNFHQQFELGEMFCTKEKIIYLLNNTNKKYYDNYLNSINKITYKDEHMEKIFKPLMPNLYNNFECKNGKYCIILNKTKDVYSLQEVFKYFNQKLEDKHVAWIVSRLSNLSCFLYNNDLVHNGINLNNCFISPTYHSVLLLGGWWYCTEETDKMIGTTKEIFSIMPIASKGNKISNSITDLECIKLIGRILLGEINCRKLNENKAIPKEIKDFLTNGSSKNAYKEFEKWDICLEKAYGKRKFVNMNFKK